MSSNKLRDSFLAGFAVGILGLFVVGVFASTIMEIFFG